MQDKNKELVLKIKQGGNSKELCYELYRQNLGFIKRMVKKYRIRKEDEEDLLQQAYFSMMKAVDGYDESKDYQFLTYLKIWLIHDFYEFNRMYNFAFSLPFKMYNEICQGQRDAPSIEQFDTRYTGAVCDFSDHIVEDCFWDAIHDVLCDRDYQIIYDHFYNAVSYAEIGRQMGLCRERVRVRAKASLKKIKRIM